MSGTLSRAIAEEARAEVESRLEQRSSKYRGVTEELNHSNSFFQRVIAFAKSFLDTPKASNDLINKSIDTEGSPASIFATRD